MVGFAKMMKQAQEVQKKLAGLQEKMEQLRVEGTAGGGMVKAVVNGKKELISLSINPDVVSRDDVQMLEDLVVAAIRQAEEKAAAAAQDQVTALTGGISIPGLGL